MNAQKRLDMLIADHPYLADDLFPHWHPGYHPSGGSASQAEAVSAISAVTSTESEATIDAMATAAVERYREMVDIAMDQIRTWDNIEDDVRHYRRLWSRKKR